MKKFLAVLLALLLAGIIFAPAIGYTIKSENKSYSIGLGEKTNYSISTGTPAHEITSMPAAQSISPRYSIGSQKVGYSFKIISAPKYSVTSGAATIAAAEPASATSAKTDATPTTTEAKAPATNDTAPAKGNTTSA